MKEGHREDIPLSENAIKVLEKRYLKKDASGNPAETPEALFRRVAKNIATADSYYGKKKEEISKTEKEFFEMIAGLEFLPNSPTLMNAGRELQQLSACFVLPIDDSMESIFETIKDTAMIHKSGGGTGFSFSRLRGKNSPVRSTGGISSGPVSFMKVFNAATQAVKQGGCVAPDTRISTGKGLARIKDLGPANVPADSWHKYNPHPVVVATDKGPYISDEFYNHGMAPVRTIKTKNGYKVTGTLKHRLRVINEKGEYVWRHIKDIKAGDWVALQKDTYIPDKPFRLPPLRLKSHFNSKKIDIPNETTAQLGEFIGYLVGDGAISLNKKGVGRLILTVSDEEKDVARRVLMTAKELFGIAPVPQKKKNDLSTNYFFNATNLVKWLKHIGVDKPSAAQAHIPEVVFKGGRQFAKGFLRGLFSADGTVTKEGYPSLSTVSGILADDLQHLLLSLGMPSGISIKRNRNGAFGKRSLYQVRIITQEGIETFAKEIGFISEKKNKRVLTGRGEEYETNDIIPNQDELLRGIYNGPGRGCAQGRKSRGANRPLYRDLQHYLPGVAAPRNLTRARLRKLAEWHPEINNNTALSWFLTNKQFYDRVVGIKEGESLTLDLSVPRSNTYIANGFVSHNTRRGANMGILRIDHPDILEFISCKENDKEITNFNISVAITEDFMKKVMADEDYDLIDPRTKKSVQKLNARKVFDAMIQMAWKNGEPGIIFLDRVNKDNPTPKIGEIESTNPCGEQPLLPYESCNLGSINLAKMVNEDKTIDWNRFAGIIEKSVHFLDNVIDMNVYPIKKIEDMTKANRKIGLGVMGFADMLFMMGIRYDSEEAIALAEKIMKFMLKSARAASEKLAKERGAFPNFKGSIYDTPNAKPVRNATLTTIAPTGTLSIIANSSSGIEPVFAISYIRNIMDNTKMVEVHPYFQEVAEARGFYKPELMSIIAQKGTIRGLEEVPQDVQELFVTAHDIEPIWHIRMQAAFQKYTNNAVSKTVNLPADAAVEDVKTIYMLAYKSGCKGVTIYRDKSREEQVLNKPSDEPAGVKKNAAKAKIAPRPRPPVTVGTTTKIATGCGNLYITINEDEQGQPFEVFMHMGKAGGCSMSQLEAIGRLLSLALRSGIETGSIVEQLRGIRCPSPSWEKGGRIFSCSDAIARAIEQRAQDAKHKRVSSGTSASGSTPVAAHGAPDSGTTTAGSADSTLKTQTMKKSGNIVGVCPDCGGALWHIEGCMVCKSCGYSKCG